MSFAEKYIHALGSSNLRDDSKNHAAEALAASALSDMSGAGIGALLCRVKYADGRISKAFEGNPANLAQLLRIWTAVVTEKGKARQWVKIRGEWDIRAAHTLYERVAKLSLAHWLDGNCKACSGTGVSVNKCICPSCKGSKLEEIECSGHFERERIKDMISELHGLISSYDDRGIAKMRRIA